MWKEDEHPRAEDGKFTNGSGEYRQNTGYGEILKGGDGKFTAKNTPPEEMPTGKPLSDGEFVETNEFRYIDKHDNVKVKGHPAHVYAKSDNKAKIMQLTHSEFIRDMEEANIKLKVNPNPKDMRTAYMIPKSEIANLSDLGKIKKGWKLSEIDEDTVVVYRDKPFNKKS